MFKIINDLQILRIDSDIVMAVILQADLVIRDILGDTKKYSGLIKHRRYKREDF